VTLSEFATIAAVSLLLIAAFSPVAALSLAGALEAAARELRRHGAAMEGAYTAYRSIQRTQRSLRAAVLAGSQDSVA
jgi:hypothetical protein